MSRHAWTAMLDRIDDKTLATLRVIAPVCGLAVLSLACRMAMVAAAGKSTVFCSLGDAVLLIAMGSLLVACGIYVGSRAVITLGFGVATLMTTLAYLPDATEAALHFGRAFPYADATLSAIDRDLAFDWMAYARWMDAHPSPWAITRLAYLSMPFLPLVVVVVLSLEVATERLAIYFVTQIACLTAVAGLAVFVPALGSYEYYHAAGAHFAHGDFVTAAYMTQPLEWLRQARLVGDGVDYHGLVSFPSYHAMSCVMNTWATWPSRRARWPMAGLNLLILIATPIQGSHYLIDIIAGIAIATLAIKPCAELVRRLSARRTAPADAPVLAPA